MGCVILERIQALCTMHELLVVFADHPIKKHIAVEPDLAIKEPATNHIIKIKCPVDEDTIKVIDPIIQKYNLKTKKIA